MPIHCSHACIKLPKWTLPGQLSVSQWLQVMTALAVAREQLHRKEKKQPRALASLAVQEGRRWFTVPEVGLLESSSHPLFAPQRIRSSYS